MTATRVLVLASLFLWTGAVEAAKPALLLLHPRGETTLDSRSLSRAVAIYTRDLGLTVRTVPTPFAGATMAGIRQAAGLVQRRNARLAFWCEPHARHTFALYTVNRDGVAGRRVLGGSQHGQAELYRAIALKLRAVLAGSGAVADEADEEIARPAPPSEAEVAPAWQVVTPTTRSSPPPPPRAVPNVPVAPAADSPVSAAGPTKPAESAESAESAGSPRSAGSAADAEKSRMGRPAVPPPGVDQSESRPATGDTPTERPPPTPRAPSANAVVEGASPPAARSRAAPPQGPTPIVTATAGPARPRRSRGPADARSRLFGTVSYLVLPPSGLAPLRQGLDLAGVIRVTGAIELDLGVEVAPEARGQGAGGSITLLDLPLRIGARMVRQREVFGVGVGAYLAAHYLHAVATDDDDQEDDITVAAGFGLEALGRARLLGAIGLELRLFAEVLAPYNRFLVGGVPVLAAGARVGLAMGVVFPF